MSDIARLLGRFFARDFLYVLGGGNILLAALLAWNGGEETVSLVKAHANISVPLAIVLAGWAHILGYFVNYTFGLVGWNTPTDRLVPWDKHYPIRGRIVRRLFRLLNRYDLDDLLQFVDRKLDLASMPRAEIKAVHIYAWEATSLAHGYLDRTFTIHHLAPVFGSTSCVAGAVVACRYLFEKDASGFYLASSLRILVAGVILCCESHYRSPQIVFAHIMQSKWLPEHGATLTSDES